MIIYIDYINEWGEMRTARVKFTDKLGVGVLIEAAWATGTDVQVTPSVLPILEELDALRHDLGGKLDYMFSFTQEAALLHRGTEIRNV